MFWKIHWQCVEVDYDGCLGGLLSDEYECRCDTWNAAMGEFCGTAEMNTKEINDFLSNYGFTFKGV